MELSITLQQPTRARTIFGPADAHLKMVRETFGVQVFARDGQIRLTGAAAGVTKAAAVFERLQRAVRQNREVTRDTVTEAIADAAAAISPDGKPSVLDVYASGKIVKPKTAGQTRYLEALHKNELVFCAGPAGTGKTYLAVAYAVHLLKHERAKRLILVRPAVEAGEKLGFLPGDMQAKVNPYLRPLFDALHDAQNTTIAQMMMFLTRMGHGSKVIVTGDDSQVDLDRGVRSGLLDARKRLSGIKGLSFIRLDKVDIVRHRLVQNIVAAYARNGADQEGHDEPHNPPEDSMPADESADKS